MGRTEAFAKPDHGSPGEQWLLGQTAFTPDGHQLHEVGVVDAFGLWYDLSGKLVAFAANRKIGHWLTGVVSYGHRQARDRQGTMRDSGSRKDPHPQRRTGWESIWRRSIFSDWGSTSGAASLQIKQIGHPVNRTGAIFLVRGRVLPEVSRKSLWPSAPVHEGMVSPRNYCSDNKIP